MIVAATFRTFPTFNVARSTLLLKPTDPATLGRIASIHAKHSFDWDKYKAGHLMSFSMAGLAPGVTMTIEVFFPSISVAEADKAIKPLMDELKKQVPDAFVNNGTIIQNINEALVMQDDPVSVNMVLGSRLIPLKVYEKNQNLIGDVYTKLLQAGTAV